MQLKPTRSTLKVTSQENQRRSPVQLSLALPGIEYAPLQVREHGLVETHTFPLVSPGKGRGGGYRSFRVHALRAWGFPSLELRSARADTCIILDCDGEDGRSRVMMAAVDKDIPLPNWVVFRNTGSAHAVWNLARPVLRGANAKVSPLRLLARISEYLAQAVEADAGYNGVLSHNPMVPDASQGLKTDWLRKRPYSLADLEKRVPFGWRRPAIPLTEIGRNCTMFVGLMQWAGSPNNLSIPVLTAAMAIYQGTLRQFPEADHPFLLAEVRGIAKSVERYRARWIKQGRFYTKAERFAWGQRMGRIGGPASGLARRKRTATRDRKIVKDRIEGLSIRAIAARYGISYKATWHVLNREAPLLLVGDSRSYTG